MGRPLDLLVVFTLCCCAAQAAVHRLGPGDTLRPVQVKPGDTVVLKDGVYKGMPPLVSGRPGSPVTYGAEHKGKAVIDTTGRGEKPGVPFDRSTELTDSVKLKGSGITISGVSHVRLRGITFRNCRTGVKVQGGAHHVVLEDIEITGARLGARLDACHDITFRNVRIHHNAKGVYMSPGAPHHILFDSVISESNDDGKGRAGDGDGFQMKPEVHHVTFRDCVARRNSEDGFDCKGESVTLERCVSAQNGGTGVKTWNTGARLYKCLVWGNTRGLAMGSFYPSRKGARAVDSLVGCTLTGNRYLQLAIGSGVHVEMRDNLIVADRGVAMTVGYERAGKGKAERVPPAPRIVAYLPQFNPRMPPESQRKAVNLLWAGRAQNMIWFGPDRRRFTADQIRNGDLPGFAKGVRFLVADPRFVSPAKGDFRPQPDSPAKGLGAAE